MARLWRSLCNRARFLAQFVVCAGNCASVLSDLFYHNGPAGSDAVILEALDRLKVHYLLDNSTTRYLSGKSIK
jgi:hypothetical protein